MWTYNNACCPGVKQQDGTHQEGTGQHHADRQQEPVAQANVLLPEKERVSIGVVWYALAHKFFTNGANTLNGLNEV